MALIKCKECGHEVSDKASACPNCGCPLEKENICTECGQPIPDSASECPNCGCPKETVDVAMSDSPTAVVEAPYYKKKGNNTNKWLWGAVVVLPIILAGLFFMSRNGDKEGGIVKEIVNLISVGRTNSERSRSVAELMSFLSKAEGVKFGNSKMQQINVRYDEKTNVVEFTIIQQIFPRSEESPDLLKKVSAASRSTRKKALRDITKLVKMMEPLRPVIRDVVLYPDGEKCYSYDIPFNELFIDDGEDDSYSQTQQSPSAWNVSSTEELEGKLVGTVWTCRPNGGTWYRLEFSSQYMTLYYAEPQMGRWIGGQERDRWSYTVEKSYTSDTGEMCLSVQFRKSGNTLSYGALFFLKGGDVEFSWLRGKYGGKAECKDFHWE